MPKYIFVAGGVMSGVGKGVATAAIGKILQSRGYSVSLIKCDMYVNIDAGTIRPTEHGEVFVGSDGIEADQDLGTYERFTNQSSTRRHYITTGQVYAEVIRKERNLEYGGEDVEVVPDIPNEIIRRIEETGRADGSDIVIVEIGGTVGEYQNILFLEAARIMKQRYKHDLLFVLVSYLPTPQKIGEMKTKPTQYASRALNGTGIQADFIICRSEHPIDQKRREKIALFCNIEPEAAIASPDMDSVYDIPLLFAKEEFDLKILSRFGLTPRKQNMADWAALRSKVQKLTDGVTIGMVGKYFSTGDFTLSDSYISVVESLKFAAWHLGLKPELAWIDSEDIEKKKISLATLAKLGGILIPGGFGSRGVEGKIAAIRCAREGNIPYFGLCFGLQLMAIEFARNVLNLKKATSEEFDEHSAYPVVHMMPDQREKLAMKDYGGSMRLGAQPCLLAKGSVAHGAYERAGWVQKKKEPIVQERHRHRYEVNDEYLGAFEKHGLTASGINPERNLVEIMELKNHPFFVGVQFHPEFLSRPLKPHPLFLEFVRAAHSRR
ncbi:MAG: CTP synthase [Candidatus Wildermuthbacteria bacterium]|nr:CTP synthase [Candidatus Wildermuthbacteria bacterium]